jgi:FtsH ternary system-associated peptide
MSRAYRIKVKESLKRDVKAEDSIQTQIELLGILPPEQMGELLARELEARGFECQEDGTMVRHDGDVTVSVDPCSGDVAIKAEAEKNIELEGTREGFGYDDIGPGNRIIKERLTKELVSDLEKRVEHESAKVQSAATGKLEKELADLQPELNEVVNRVTSEALKQKAAQLGTIKEISEDQEAGSLTIKVEV